ncbi:LysM peptidoglycan-binding domain-containing protein [Pontivivens insulae]|uniref:LysM domain-containing protein n=1 Tax=Pontivivens insulae TaxID=1639689 RepID=A0A2R8AA95_9RHOB|nr:LysM peptidoglycan-binding domain-containing protein [Pontivivens insulae]RED13041.1 hypothetical protein DFR53_2176 [Pontivivens insulae]SPF29133.1 hypothetical protein POI8812_01439 [Pontivivens insulae]
MSNTGWGIAGVGAIAAAILAYFTLAPGDAPVVEEPELAQQGETAESSEPTIGEIALSEADATDPDAVTEEVAPEESDDSSEPVEAVAEDAAQTDDDAPELEVAEAPAEDDTSGDEAAEADAEAGEEVAEAAAEDEAAEAAANESGDLADAETSSDEDVSNAGATAEAEIIAPEADADDSAELVEDATAIVEAENETVTDAEAESVAAEPEQTNDNAPTFDLVRVERDGSAVIAGRAEPQSEVEIIADGEVIGTVVAGSSGEFVALLDTPATTGPQSLTLESVTEFGETAESNEAVIVIVPDAAEEATRAEPPTVILSTPRAVEVIQPTVAPVDNIVLDTITYSAEGEVVLTGRGEPGSAAFIYADDRPIVQADIRQDGNWTAVVNELEAGIYTLRVDEVAEDGDVTSRVESPFQREEPELVEETFAEVEDEALQITVQPGNNLWTIARERYGEGPLFTLIFEANEDQIRDPDLIYPGQIFDLPE